MLYVFPNLTPARNRVPRAGHWAFYRHAATTRPSLIADVYNAIELLVQSNPGTLSRFPNSTWFGHSLLNEDQPWAADWDELTNNELDKSSSLFGQVMWTVMFDRPTDWATTLTSNANPGMEERVYWPLGA
jgi:hypothetical protein